MSAPLETLLSGAMARAGIGREVYAAMLVSVADQVLHTELGEGSEVYLRARAYADGVLTLAYTHSAVAEEARARQEAWMGQLLRRMPTVVIRTVRYVPRDQTDRGASWSQQDVTHSL